MRANLAISEMGESAVRMVRLVLLFVDEIGLQSEEGPSSRLNSSGVNGVLSHFLFLTF